MSTTLLNKFPVLEHGYVRLQTVSPDAVNLAEIRKRAYKGTLQAAHLELPYVHMEICCPYAVLLTLASSGLTLVPYQDMNKDMAHIPGLDDIKSGSIDIDWQISESLKLTIESTMLNQHAYAEDGCDRSVATLTTPLAAYWEGVVHGKLLSFLRFTESKHQPKIIRVYQERMRDSISSEYKNLQEMIERL